MEIELLDEDVPLTGKSWDPVGKVWVNAALNTSTGTASVFTNPDVHNKLETTAVDPIKVRSDRLRYRVRFRYPIDPLADPGAGTTVNPANHYLLDTPVFDDISVVYFTRLRVLDYQEVTE